MTIFSFEKYVEDLEAVMAATGFQRFAMFGLDGGAATSIAYAARHPEQVTHLAIHGCYTRGRIARSSTPEQHAYAETQLNAVALGWGAENPAFRQLFAALLMPEATEAHVRSFNELIGIATTPDNAANLLRAYYHVDLRETATQVRCPCIVFHPRQDAQISFEEGRMLAALIAHFARGARMTASAIRAADRSRRHGRHPPFSFFAIPGSVVIHGSAERNQFCFFGTNSLRWRRMPTRTR